MRSHSGPRIIWVRAFGALGLALLLLASAEACRPDRIVAPPDTTAPHLQVLSPHDTLYDLDGDKLVDVRLTWTDAGGVNPASVRLRSLHPLNGPADTTTNLLDVWRVTQRDSTGLWVRETLANLLPDGANALEVSVADTAGNRTTDTLHFTLPPAAYYDSIPTGVSTTIDNVTDIAITHDGRRGYATVHYALIVFDPEALRVITSAPSDAASRLQAIVLDETHQTAYVSSVYIERFDLATSTSLGKVPGTWATEALAFSRTNSSLLYAGESFDGWLGYVDVSANKWIDGMAIPHTEDQFTFDIALLAGDAKLYMTRYADSGGILVLDPRTKQILKSILYAGNTRFYAGHFDLTADDRHLYVALKDAEPRGIADLRTDLDSIVRTMDFPAYVPAGIRLSPSQRRLFLTTVDRFPEIPGKNVLIDLPNWRVLQEFDRPHATGTIRRDGPIAFRPDGKLIFVGREQVIDVYLNRELLQ